jgi:predicted metal-dependent hydrolase
MDRATKRSMMERLNRDARRIAIHFGIRYRLIEAERANVTSRFGVCYSDGVIKIRLCHAVTGQPLRYSSLVSTLCHELAHLRYFNHGLRFRAFNQELLEFARSEGIYQPRAPGSAVKREKSEEVTPSAHREKSPTGAVQLSLF